MRFTFVHAADLHLDSPLPAGGRVDERLRPHFEAATFRAFERVAGLALERRASFLLLAGDLFEARDRSVRARLFIRDQARRLERAGIRVFAVHGNHDPLCDERGSLELPPNVKVFGPSWEEIPVVLDGRVACRIQGISYPVERVEENLARRFSRRGEELTVGVLHANVGANRAHASYAPASWEDLSAARLDYWALGHVHTRSETRLGTGGLAVYPGNTQGRHMLETGPRGCVVVQVDGSRCRTEFVAVDSIRWHEVPVDVEGISDLGRLEAEIEEAVLETCRGPVDAHAVRVVLQGRTPLYGELGSADAQEQLETRLRDTLRRGQVPVALESLVNACAGAVDLEQVRAEGGLRAVVLEQAEATGVDQLFQVGALKSLDESLSRLGLPPTRVSADLLLGRAARRAVELLTGEGT